MCLPAIEYLKDSFPDSRITALAKDWVIPIFSNNPHINEVMEYDHKYRHKGLTGKLWLIGELKEKEFDTAILFQNAFEAALIAYMAGIPRRLGYTTDNRSLLLTDSILPGGQTYTQHLIDYYLEIPRYLHFKVEPRMDPVLSIAEIDRLCAMEYLKDHGVDTDSPILGVAPGAAYGPAKMWPSERFAEVAESVLKDRRGKALLFGSKKDKEACNTIHNLLEEGCVNLAGKTTLNEAMALISLCNLFITNDSGLMHIASALGIPTIAIFGSTDPKRTGPSGPRDKVLYKAVDCSPCHERTCPTDFKCMKDITVEEVLRAILELCGDDLR